MDEGRGAESDKAVLSGSSVGVEASVSILSPGTLTLAAVRRTTACQRCSASQLKKKRRILTK